MFTFFTVVTGKAFLEKGGVGSLVFTLIVGAFSAFVWFAIYTVVVAPVVPTNLDSYEQTL
jgi:hypothetical protein